MTIFFLVAIMVWHEDGDTFTRRMAVTPSPSGEICQAVADELRKQWQTEHPAATVLIECLPVGKGRKT